MFASVLIVNYNSGPHLAKCLDALNEQSYRPFEIIVVENASCDDSLMNALIGARSVSEGSDRYTLAHASGSEIPCRIVRLRANVGFAEGNNIAAQHAVGDPLVLLNPDTLPDPFWLEELLRTMTSRNATAAVSKLVFADHPNIINSGGLTLLRDGRGADAGFRQKDDGQFETEREVFAGCGAALAIRRHAFRLDGSLFLYYEDLDAGWRLRADGGSIWYSPRSLVLHAVGASEQSPTHRYYVERNRVLTAIRHADLPLAVYSFLLLLVKVPQALLRWVAGRLPRRTAFAVPHAFFGVLAHLPSALIQRYLNRHWRIRRCESS